MDRTDIYRIISDNIQYLRTRYGLTQSEMASIMGISVRTLRRLEAGATGVRMHCLMLNRVCDHFNVSADVMLRERLGEAEN